MAESRIPVDLFNPGQVFACLGFMEAAEVLLGEAEGGFDWSNPADVRFVLRAAGAAGPVGEVLGFLASAELRRFAPNGYSDPPRKKKSGERDDGNEAEDDGADTQGATAPPEVATTFPAPQPDRMSLPIRLGRGDLSPIELTHWADGSGRDPLKLYAGNRSAFGIAEAMRLDLRQLYDAKRDEVSASPFGVTSPMGGSFNFDPRGAWTALDAGYSLNDQKHRIDASPIVELLAAWGLENARPKEIGLRRYRYAVWQKTLPPALARPAIAGSLDVIPKRHFVIRLNLSGRNKVMTYAEEEAQR